MSSESRLLEVVCELAHGITDSAVWYDGRCNWVGAISGYDARGSLAVASLGGDLYGGTAGVALFLAEACVRLDDEAVRATALGAVRHALDHADRIDREHRDGLYLGPIGIAYAAIRVAGLLDAASVRASACDVLRRWRQDDERSASADLMSGSAGAVAGMVALIGLVDEPWLVDEATRSGDRLIDQAEKTPAGWCWTPPGSGTMYPLCGLAHGAAGIGHALAELFGVTGEGRFGNAAERAFDYERSWFDPETGTWPDLRGVARRAGRDAPMPTADSWCNGAPGIALSRIRAAEVLGSMALLDDAELALAACERHARELLAHAPSDFSLCHGAAGVGDVLLFAPPGPTGRRADLAGEIGRRGIERHHGPRASPFACGAPRGETPGLLLGYAGIGMFYLRLLDRQVPSPLLVRGSVTLTPSSVPT